MGLLEKTLLMHLGKPGGVNVGGSEEYIKRRRAKEARLTELLIGMDPGEDLDVRMKKRLKRDRLRNETDDMEDDVEFVKRRKKVEEEE